MSVAAAAFRPWVANAGLPDSTAPLARTIGVNRTTLQAQLFRGRVHETVVVAAARAAGVDPVRALSEFDEYEDLHDGMRPPLPGEVLSQIGLDDALVELTRRRRPEYGAALAAVQEWQDPPLPAGVRQWVDAVDPGSIRAVLAERFGIAAPNLSALITANKLKPRQLVEAARVAHTSSVSGLAAAGVVTLHEAGWPANARATALGRLRDTALHDLVTARIAGAQRGARRAEAERTAADRIEDTLG